MFALGIEINAGLREIEAARAARNRALLATAIAPNGPDDVRVGDLVIPLEELWQRGPGRVDEVDSLGRVWAVYGQRERPHPTDSKTVRCFSPWTEVRILPKS